MATEDKVEVLQDFSLGLNTLSAPNRLDSKYASAMSNVWNDDGAIQKRLGQLRTSTTNSLWGVSWLGISLHTSVFSATENLLILADSGFSRNVIVYTTDAAAINRAWTATTGTCSTAVASPTVTGSGTNWLTTARAGAIFSIGNTRGQILTVDSDTQLTLTANFGVLNSGTTGFITNSWAPTSRVSFVDMNNKAWICGQGSTAVSFDGTNEVFIDAFPKASYSLAYKNYVFAANTAANPSRISWSSLKDPTTWPASNFIDVNPDDGFPICGLVYDGQSIVILKTNSAWKLSGDNVFDPANPTYTLTQIYTPSDFTVNSPKSFQLFGPGGYIILGRKGLYSYNGAGAIAKILDFDRIRGEFANINWTGIGTVPSPNTEVSSILVDGNYWLQVPNSLSSISSADKELTYVIDKSGAVWKWTALAGGIISDFAYLNGTLYGVNSWSGGTPGLIQLNTGSTNGLTDAINGSFTTKVIEFDSSQRFGTCYVYFKKQSAGNLTFEWSIDEGSFTSNTIDMTTGTGVRVKSAPMVIGQVGRSVQFRISNNVAAQTFEVYAIEFNRQELRR